MAHRARLEFAVVWLAQWQSDHILADRVDVDDALSVNHCSNPFRDRAGVSKHVQPAVRTGSTGFRPLGTFAP
jgi:hypothetical protein